jgi:hypothetical protein
MKRTHQIILILCCLLVGFTASAEHRTYLRGIVNVPGFQAALLEIQHTLVTRSNSPPVIVPTSRLVRGREQFEDDTIKGGHFEFEVLECDFARQTVKTREAGEEHAYSLTGAALPSEARNWLYLQKAAFNDVLDIYSELAGRIILFHPAVDRAPVSVEAVWTNQVPEREEITDVFKKYFNERGASAILDGRKFLQLVPSNMSQAGSPNSKDLPAGAAGIGGIMASGPVENLVNVYAGLSGRRRVGSERIAGSIPYLHVRQSLSQPEVLYVLETFLGWNEARIVFGDDNTFSIVPAQH